MKIVQGMYNSRSPLSVLVISLLTLLTFAQQPNDIQQNSARLSVSVTDKTGQPVKDLRQEDFLLFVDNKPQPITSFSKEELPVSYILFVDHTGSMRLRLKETIEVAKKIVENNKPGDEAMIVRIINGEIQGSSWSSDKNAMTNYLDGLNEARGQLSLLDSFYYCGQKFSSYKKDINRHRALIAITDGLNISSKVKMSQLLDLLRQEKVRTFAINIYKDNSYRMIVNKNDPAVPPTIDGSYASQRKEDALNFLDGIAKGTNGQAFLSDSSDKRLTFAGQILNSLRSQYTIAYTPAQNKEGNSNRKIRLKLINAHSKNNYSVATNSSFFPSEK